MQINNFTRNRRLDRQHPIFSPVGLLSTLFLGIGLVAGVYMTGGRAFSPGPLSAVNHSGMNLAGVLSHAEIHDDCGQCHEPFVGIVADRCEQCHEQVASERAGKEEMHGRFPNAADCAACHLEHRGEDYDLKTAALANFDHELTDYSLRVHQVDYHGLPIACGACHRQEERFTLQLTACADCHREESVDFMADHQAAYGENCIDCHDGRDTIAQVTIADHEEFFPLTGVHNELDCAVCHVGGQFAGIPGDCQGCHQEPLQHAALFPESCDTCHATTAWLPAAIEGVLFDHELSTTFSLTQHQQGFNDEKFRCTSCHLAGQTLLMEDGRCLQCHQEGEADFMRQHTETFGTACRQCHDGTGRMANFSHDQVWPLDGRHAELDCAGCHQDHQFKGTATACAACHEEPEIHRGSFGLTCHYCHTSEAWLPARLRVHQFPLDHAADGAQDCNTCHTTSTYESYTCTTCHEHELSQMEKVHADVDLQGNLLVDCASCHAQGLIEETQD